MLTDTTCRIYTLLGGFNCALTNWLSQKNLFVGGRFLQCFVSAVELELGIAIYKIVLLMSSQI